MAIKIFIDQGHNPTNPNAGAEGNGLREQDITYNIGVILADLLRANGNFEVMLSRNSPTEQLGTSNASSLAARVNAANEWGADYFISLHTNAFSNPSASGVEAYAYRTGTEGFRLGENIVDQLSLITGLENRGTFARPSLYVLRRTNMPATLIEMGYITNPGDAALMSGEPDLFALGIYNGILQFFGL
ncbi:MAG: N-acetylmuramoyl-L-alanine amidase [Clostridia bacterium]|nr:N-acetylmuramoyl-L-alanine amidase [Clostridia bacterium]